MQWAELVANSVRGEREGIRCASQPAYLRWTLCGWIKINSTIPASFVHHRRIFVNGVFVSLRFFAFEGVCDSFAYRQLPLAESRFSATSVVRQWYCTKIPSRAWCSETPAMVFSYLQWPFEQQWLCVGPRGSNRSTRVILNPFTCKAYGWIGFAGFHHFHLFRF